MNLLNIKQTLNAQNIELVHVVAFDKNHCIGKDNQLAWHIPEDLKHFKDITSGGVIVMGRKTFESMGRALPNRINWVITRDKNWSADGVKIAYSLERALELASEDIENINKKQLFIIGGGDIFKQTLPIMDRLEITRVDLDVQGDAFYPSIPIEFTLIHREHGTSAKNGVNYIFETYRQLHQQDKVE
ncbi:dihydrofolate reductase [Moraxella sp. ZY210820]|uniref:dihydrofolate reductase n=1 Tax=unclassified Moraxella TaxID=2685852 RepID=UPI0027301BF5|nr:dihydrofolate reductase [Moraxella sp. ZY210820]WLF84238.1 dihydrofolate reductase [Moraxella sp. ZY210820]